MKKKKKASKGHARASEIIASLARFVSLVNPARTHLGLIPSRRLFGQRNAKKEKERERERERGIVNAKVTLTFFALAGFVLVFSQSGRSRYRPPSSKN